MKHLWILAIVFGLSCKGSSSESQKGDVEITLEFANDTTRLTSLPSRATGKRKQNVAPTDDVPDEMKEAKLGLADIAATLQVEGAPIELVDAFRKVLSKEGLGEVGRVEIEVESPAGIDVTAEQLKVSVFIDAGWAHLPAVTHYNGTLTATVHFKANGASEKELLTRISERVASKVASEILNARPKGAAVLVPPEGAVSQLVTVGFDRCLIKGDRGALCAGNQMPFIPVPGMEDVVQLASTSNHRLCGRTAKGEAVCFNTANGRGVKTFRGLNVCGVSDAKYLAITEKSACYAKEDGSVHCADITEFPETCEDVPATREVAGPVGVTQLAAGSNSICALGVDQKVWCWKDASGPLQATEVPELKGMASIDVGGASAACGLSSEGRSVVCINRKGETKTVSLEEPATALTAGSKNCVVLASKKVSCWLAWAPEPVPTVVNGVEGTVSLDNSINGVCAVLESGNVLCWAEHMGKSDEMVELSLGPMAQ
tara:strand:- start:21859 stop:23316 length:1458 start_codon:yes stop_codon:yes gene_type:complete